jgi:hypothetical protein
LEIDGIKKAAVNHFTAAFRCPERDSNPHCRMATGF